MRIKSEKPGCPACRAGPAAVACVRETSATVPRAAHGAENRGSADSSAGPGSALPGSQEQITAAARAAAGQGGRHCGRGGDFFFWPRAYAARAAPPGPRWSRGPGGRGNAAVALRELRKPPRPAPSCCASWPSARTNGRVTGNVACSMHVAINNTLCGRCHDEGCTVEWRYTFQYNQSPSQHHRSLSMHATSPSHLCCCSAAACSCQVAMNALLS